MSSPSIDSSTLVGGNLCVSQRRQSSHFFTPCSEHEDLANIIHRENSGSSEQNQNHLISPGAAQENTQNTMPIQAEQTGIPGPLSSQYENFGGLEFSRDDDNGFFVEHIYTQVGNRVQNINLSNKSFLISIHIFANIQNFTLFRTIAEQTSFTVLLHNIALLTRTRNQSLLASTRYIHRILFMLIFLFSIFLHNQWRSNRSNS